MLVRFIYKGPRGERGEEEWMLDAVPRIGDYVHLDTVQGEVEAVSWIAKTFGGRKVEAQVILSECDSL